MNIISRIEASEKLNLLTAKMLFTFLICLSLCYLALIKLHDGIIHCRDIFRRDVGHYVMSLL
ncbi:hypothetical protein ES708_16010 [subsurface metagenome]